nr:DUF6671 family protein [Nostoc commune]
MIATPSSPPQASLTFQENHRNCEFCQFPTTLPLTAIYQCKKCGFNQEKLFPNGIEFANQAQCMYCNP